MPAESRLHRTIQKSATINTDLVVAERIQMYLTNVAKFLPRASSSCWGRYGSSFWELDHYLLCIFLVVRQVICSEF